MQAEIDRQKTHRFDFFNAGLFRFVSVSNGDQNALLFSFHHLILDGWSVASLLAQLFTGLNRGALPIAEPCDYRFADYVALEKNLLAEQSLLQAAQTIPAIQQTGSLSQQYWQTSIASAKQSMLGVKRPGTGQDSLSLTYHDIISQSIALSAKQQTVLAAKASALQVPIKTLCMALHSKVLMELLSCGQLTTGYVSNGRLETAGYDAVLGLHLNTLPLIVDAQEKTLDGFIQALFEHEIADMPHRRYPLTDILKSAQHSVLFNTVVNFTNFHVYADHADSGLDDSDAIQISDITVHEFTDFDFVSSFSIHPETQQLALSINFNQQTIPPGLAETIQQTYLAVIQWFVQSNATVLAASPVLSSQTYHEQRQQNQQAMQQHLLALPQLQAVDITTPSAVDDSLGALGLLVPAPEFLPQISAWSQYPEAKRHRLSNDMEIACINEAETDFIFEEIFTSGILKKVPLVLPEQPIIFDVGANIGLFTLYLHNRYPMARIYSYEPIVEIYQALDINAAVYNIPGQTHQLGLSNRVGQAQINYYRNNTLISGQYTDESDIRVSAQALRNNMVQANTVQGADKRDQQQLEDYLAAKLISETQIIQLSTLSEQIVRHGITQIDLLKIDVEKAELDVLQGIHAEHWSIIQNVFIEVHDLEGRLEHIQQLLTVHGFAVHIEQEDLLHDTNIFNLVAMRDPVQLLTTPLDVPWRYAETRFLTSIDAHLMDYSVRSSGPSLVHSAVPTHWQLVPEISAAVWDSLQATAAMPLTANQALQDCSADKEQYLAMCSIWQQLLVTDIVDGQKSFYAYGGDSISLLRLLRKINLRFACRIPVQSIDMNMSPLDMLALTQSHPSGLVVDDLVSHAKAAGTDITLCLVVPFATPKQVYADLIKRLSTQYSIKLLSLSDDVYDDQPIGDIASHYIHELAPQLTADAVLVGWSLGSVEVSHG